MTLSIALLVVGSIGVGVFMFGEVKVPGRRFFMTVAWMLMFIGIYVMPHTTMSAGARIVRVAVLVAVVTGLSTLAVAGVRWLNRHRPDAGVM